MASISSQLEELYMSCSRKDMTDTLTEILLAACVTPTLMPDRLLMEHVLLVSILHHAVGLEVNIHPSFLHHSLKSIATIRMIAFVVFIRRIVHFISFMLILSVYGDTKYFTEHRSRVLTVFHAVHFVILLGWSTVPRDSCEKI